MQQVKEQIAAKLQIPREFQKLVIGLAVVPDTVRLDMGPVSMNLVVSVENVCIDLENAAPLPAIKLLTTHPKFFKGNARAIAAVAARLEDDDEDVRSAAVDALAKIVDKGNGGVIAAVAARLEHDSEDVRCSATKALAQIADKGNEAAITAVAARLEVDEGWVRCAAVEALAQIADNGNEVAIADDAKGDAKGKDKGAGKARARARARGKGQGKGKGKGTGKGKHDGKGKAGRIRGQRLVGCGNSGIASVHGATFF